MSKIELAKRYMFFLFGLFVSAVGISFVTKAGLGTSPISSIPYTLSIGFVPTMGQFTLGLSVLLIILQLVLLRKGFPKQYWLQIPISFLFSYFIDLSMKLLVFLETDVYALKIIYLLIGCAILGSGVFMEIVANVVMLPGEAFVNSIVLAFHTDFGKTKVAVDTTLTAVAIVIGFVFYHNLAGAREGTIVAAILVGLIAKFLKRKIGFIEKYLMDKKNLNRDRNSMELC